LSSSDCLPELLKDIEGSALVVKVNDKIRSVLDYASSKGVFDQALERLRYSRRSVEQLLRKGYVPFSLISEICVMIGSNPGSRRLPKYYSDPIECIKGAVIETADFAEEDFEIEKEEEEQRQLVRLRFDVRSMVEVYNVLVNLLTLTVGGWFIARIFLPRLGISERLSDVIGVIAGAVAFNAMILYRYVRERRRGK